MLNPQATQRNNEKEVGAPEPQQDSAKSPVSGSGMRSSASSNDGGPEPENSARNGPPRQAPEGDTGGSGDSGGSESQGSAHQAPDTLNVSGTPGEAPPPTRKLYSHLDQLPSRLSPAAASPGPGPEAITSALQGLSAVSRSLLQISEALAQVAQSIAAVSTTLAEVTGAIDALNQPPTRLAAGGLQSDAAAKEEVLPATGTHPQTTACLLQDYPKI